ncbi:cytochrome b/b6 domain-containing protein [Polynucleobacter sp. MG-Unter2-18]|uniref:cytochrome b/b6 domain-containing protein n=1 Tax=Polynucleobacter TaxID=44013 RepID=UPI001BFE24A5|nr:MULTISPECIES: cytochrome b/b6 domain-containing protein [Polynucleobacter]MBU3560177.1 cytochrome b/b6 domain-containing protein [Polynucleobacter hallstattensis]QWD95260.1 cytochrome b/b6 domain-containing protein [Polynucleobacter sp. MG-Unter2-18]
MNNSLNDAVGATGRVRQAIMVWDIPVRVFHWLLVICFAGAWLSSESERWALIHYAFGYTACLLVLIRLVWGLIGTRYARFSQFLKSPKAVIGHFMSMLRGHLHHDVGHNPAGGLVMFALMLLILFIGFTGYLSVKEFLGDIASEAHEVVANVVLGIVIIHIIAAIGMSLIERQNLVRSMVNGKKQGMPEQGIRYPQYLIGSLIFLSALYFFYLTLSGSLPSLTQ